MKISSLSIGDELIYGEVIDTNATFIAAALTEHGLHIQRHQTVGDNEPDIIGALADTARTSDAVIVTGGLGPTADDVTALAAARATGRRLLVNKQAKQHIRQISGGLNPLYVCPLSDKQALVPARSSLIPNPTGTACGFHFMHDNCFMIFLPGVPSEMSRMMQESVIPFLLKRIKKHSVIRSARINLFGLAESRVDERLQGIARPAEGLHLGICVTFPWMRVTLRAEADSEKAASALLTPAAEEAVARLKDWTFSYGTQTMDDVVAALFRERNVTLSLAESCTGGMIAQRITNEAGSSAYFREGAITYSNEAKIRSLGVSGEIIETFGAVSAECAEAMARGIRLCTGSDIGLAVTGIAGPDGGTEEKPVGTVYISLAVPDGCRTRRFQFVGGRDIIRTLTTWTALDWLRRYLLQLA